MPGSFVHFAALPVEIRLNIWRLARQPRVVEVWYDAKAECCRTTSRPPAILHVNRESRTEALHKGWYLRAFRTRAHADRYIYFSSSLDVLYLPRHGLMGYDDTARDFTVYVRDTADHVRALAIDHVRPSIIRPWEPYNKLMLLLSFPDVRETMLVVGKPAAPGPVRQRSQDAQDTSEHAPSSPVEDHVEIELVDPQGDTSEIKRAISSVILAFALEIQTVDAVAGRVVERVAERVAERHSSPNNAVNEDEALRHGPIMSQLPCLVPKAIAYHHHQRQRQRYSHSMAIHA